MGFHEGAFATVWEITNQGDNFSKVRLSISRKDKKSDEYVTDFNGSLGLSERQTRNSALLIPHCLLGIGAESRLERVMYPTSTTRTKGESTPTSPCSTLR